MDKLHSTCTAAPPRLVALRGRGLVLAEVRGAEQAVHLLQVVE